MRIRRSIAWVCLLPLWAHALDIDGIRYIALGEVAGKLGMETRWLETGERLRLQSQWTRLDFEKHQRAMELNGYRVHLGFPVAESRQRLYISESDFHHHIRPILTPHLNGPPPRLRHIVLDAGHGGEDPGAENSSLGLREKALTLDLAKRLHRLLEARGFQVSLTRGDDRFIALEERAAMANRIGADLFISLHFNALEKARVHGLETYAFTPPNQPSTARAELHPSDRRDYPGQANGDWNALLGYYVQRSLIDALPSPDRGLKRARFTVLRDLRMPGILVEGGFITNPAEGRNIGSAAYRQGLAQAIADGILVYQRTLERLRERES